MTRICWLLGHKYVIKVATGKTYETRSYGGNPLSVSLMTLVQLDYCARCGLPRPKDAK